jgi:outer membrane protein assembly factor BamB
MTGEDVPGMQAKRVMGVLGCWVVMAFPTAADWPQWLGPHRTGISSERGPARLLAQPQLVWTNFVGLGCSSFAIAQNRAYTLGHAKQARNRGTDTLYCLDADTGKVIWRYSYECASCISQDVKFDGPRSTPTVDGDCVYSLSLEGHLFCLEAVSGSLLWARQLTRDLEGRIPAYGYCCSPLVHGNNLILELNAPEASYVALDKRTGALVWRLKQGQVTCGSPVLTRVDGLDWVVFAGGGAMVAADTVTGRELWRHRTWAGATFF